MVNDNTAQTLTCANCGEVSTNPGQFTPDGRWVCTAVCRDELFASMAANGGIPQDEDRPEVSGNDVADEIEAKRGMKVRAVSLRGAVEYGLANGKRNMIVDLDLLSEILIGHVPVGNNQFPPEDVTALLYQVKEERDRLQAMTCDTPNRRNFSDELTCLLNKYSKENGSNTPDFILTEYLMQQLEAWNLAVKAREERYGRRFYSLGAVRPVPQIAREIAARVWCDQEMRNCVMDVGAAEEIAAIVDRVRHEQANKRSYDDLAASGGIVDAP